MSSEPDMDALQTESQFHAGVFVRQKNGASKRFVRAEIKARKRKPSVETVALWMDESMKMGFMSGFIAARTTPDMFAPKPPTERRFLGFLWKLT